MIRGKTLAEGAHKGYFSYIKIARGRGGTFEVLDQFVQGHADVLGVHDGLNDAAIQAHCIIRERGYRYLPYA